MISSQYVSRVTLLRDRVPSLLNRERMLRLLMDQD